MLTLVLKNNNFTFDGNHYLQINGTAMGIKMAPRKDILVFDTSCVNFIDGWI
jgi:hypothetical protein